MLLLAALACKRLYHEPDENGDHRGHQHSTEHSANNGASVVATSPSLRTADEFKFISELVAVVLIESTRDVVICGTGVTVDNGGQIDDARGGGESRNVALQSNVPVRLAGNAHGGARTAPATFGIVRTSDKRHYRLRQ